MVHGVSVRGGALPSSAEVVCHFGFWLHSDLPNRAVETTRKNNLLVSFVKLNHISAASPPPPSRAGARSALPLEVMVVVPFTQVWRLLYDNLYIARDSVRNQLQRVLQVRPDEADGLLH